MASRRRCREQQEMWVRMPQGLQAEGELLSFRQSACIQLLRAVRRSEATWER